MMQVKIELREQYVIIIYNNNRYIIYIKERLPKLFLHNTVNSIIEQINETIVMQSTNTMTLLSELNYEEKLYIIENLPNTNIRQEICKTIGKLALKYGV